MKFATGPRLSGVIVVSVMEHRPAEVVLSGNIGFGETFGDVATLREDSCFFATRTHLQLDSPSSLSAPTHHCHGTMYGTEAADVDHALPARIVDIFLAKICPDILWRESPRLHESGCRVS